MSRTIHEQNETKSCGVIHLTKRQKNLYRKKTLYYLQKVSPEARWESPQFGRVLLNSTQRGPTERRMGCQETNLDEPFDIASAADKKKKERAIRSSKKKKRGNMMVICEAKEGLAGRTSNRLRMNAPCLHLLSTFATMPPFLPSAVWAALTVCHSSFFFPIFFSFSVSHVLRSPSVPAASLLRVSVCGVRW